MRHEQMLSLGIKNFNIVQSVASSNHVQDSPPPFRFRSFESIMSYRLRKYMYIASIPTDLMCATLRSDVSYWQRQL
jgi:hypothetical protein